MKGRVAGGEGIKSVLKKIYHVPTVKKAVIDVVSLFNPPPYRRDLMEFEFDVWSGATAMHCINKRQLGENNTFPGFYRENIPTEYHKCGFEGSRAGLPMNMTALHEVMNHWKPALGLINAIRHCYKERFNITDKELDPAGLFVLAKICAALPAFLVRRAQKPVFDGEIPVSVAAAFKITAGVFMVLRKTMENGIRWNEIGHPASGAELYEYADRHNVFVSSSGRVCSGSRRKIIELIDFMIKGEGDDKRMPESLLELEGLVTDIGVFLDYSAQALTLEVLVALSRSVAAKAFTSIDLNFLQIGEHQSLGISYAKIINHVRRMLPEEISLENQHEVLCGLLEKLNAGDCCEELKRRITENGYKVSGELVKQTPHLPAEFRDSFARAVGEYLAILGFLRNKGEDLQNRILSVLGRRKTVRLSMIVVERRLGIVDRREIQNITGFDMSHWYEMKA